jgi:hypothetical protein
MVVDVNPLYELGFAVEIVFEPSKMTYKSCALVPPNVGPWPAPSYMVALGFRVFRAFVVLRVPPLFSKLFNQADPDGAVTHPPDEVNATGTYAVPI